MSRQWSAPDSDGWQHSHHRDGTDEWQKLITPEEARRWGAPRRYARVYLHSDGAVYGTSHTQYSRKFTTVEEAKRLLSPHEGTSRND